MRLFLKSILVVFFVLCFIRCSSSDDAQTEEETTSSASEAVCIVSTQYTTGEQVTTAVSTTDFDGDCILDDGDDSGYATDEICTGGVRTDCDDNCPDVYNILQEDTDSDGVGDECDNCTETENTDQADNDIDGIGDACDTQSDHDSISDDTDNCPYVTNEDQTDSDVDGVGDACEEAEEEECDNSCDLDGDGMGNDCDDDDDDDDSVTDEYDVCPFSKSATDCSSTYDTDGDGVVDTIDNCASVSNVCQTDADGDGMGSDCDTNGDDFKDTDGDGIADDSDSCAELYDTSNACADTDGDSVYDLEDNCPDDSNEDQNDDDADGKGDVCDTETSDSACRDDEDNDGDGMIDCSDSACYEKSFCDLDSDGTINEDDEDIDDDGLYDTIDLCDYDVDSSWSLIKLNAIIYTDERCNMDTDDTEEGYRTTWYYFYTKLTDEGCYGSTTISEADMELTYEVLVLLYGSILTVGLGEFDDVINHDWSGNVDLDSNYCENCDDSAVLFGCANTAISGDSYYSRQMCGTLQDDEDSDGVGDECEGRDVEKSVNINPVLPNSITVHP